MDLDISEEPIKEEHCKETKVNIDIQDTLAQQIFDNILLDMRVISLVTPVDRKDTLQKIVGQTNLCRYYRTG